MNHNPARPSRFTTPIDNYDHKCRLSNPRAYISTGSRLFKMIKLNDRNEWCLCMSSVVGDVTCLNPGLGSEDWILVRAEWLIPLCTCQMCDHIICLPHDSSTFYMVEIYLSDPRGRVGRNISTLILSIIWAKILGVQNSKGNSDSDGNATWNTKRRVHS